jgi:hypothetical protein
MNQQILVVILHNSIVGGTGEFAAMVLCNLKYDSTFLLGILFASLFVALIIVFA